MIAKPRTESEVDLCDRLRDWAERLGFEVYPEVNGWDMVLVASKPIALAGVHDIPAGAQVGIHAKLRANCDVLMQAVAYSAKARYPDFPFVAAPQAGAAFRFIARRLGVGVIDTDPTRRARRRARYSSYEVRDRDPDVTEWPRFHNNPPLELPPIASRAITAGAPSPRVLSEWRTKALRFLIWARTQPTFTVIDVQRFGINRSWAERWGDFVETVPVVRRGRNVRVHVYRLTSNKERLPDWGYADVAAEILAADAKGAA